MPTSTDGSLNDEPDDLADELDEKNSGFGAIEGLVVPLQKAAGGGVTRQRQ